MPSFSARMPGLCGRWSYNGLTSTLDTWCSTNTSYGSSASSIDPLTRRPRSLMWLYGTCNFARNNPYTPHPRHTTKNIKAYSEMIVQHLYNSIHVQRREPSTSSLTRIRRRQVRLWSILMLLSSLSLTCLLLGWSPGIIRGAAFSSLIVYRWCKWWTRLDMIAPLLARLWPISSTLLVALSLLISSMFVSKLMLLLIC